MPNLNLPFFVEYESGALLVFDINIEDRAAHRDDGAGSSDLVVVGKSP